MRLWKLLLGTLCAFCIACAGDPDTGAIVDSDAGEDVARTDTRADAGGDSATDSTPTDDGPTTDASTAPLCSERLEPGALIRGTGPAVYYIARDLRRWVFPNSATYFSWYGAFDGICQIPDERLDRIHIAGNVTFRAGTWLAKITTDPKVYAITRCGVLHWIETEELATTLYGPYWNMGLMVEIPESMVRRTRDVPDAFFVNYTIGASIARPAHPDGTLIRYSGDPTVYILTNGRRREVTTDGFRLNRFNQWFIADTTIAYPDSPEPPVTEYERELSDPSCP